MERGLHGQRTGQQRADFVWCVEFCAVRGRLLVSDVWLPRSRLPGKALFTLAQSRAGPTGDPARSTDRLSSEELKPLHQSPLARGHARTEAIAHRFRASSLACLRCTACFNSACLTIAASLPVAARACPSLVSCPPQRIRARQLNVHQRCKKKQKNKPMSLVRAELHAPSMDQRLVGITISQNAKHVRRTQRHAPRAPPQATPQPSTSAFQSSTSSARALGLACG